MYSQQNSSSLSKIYNQYVLIIFFIKKQKYNLPISYDVSIAGILKPFTDTATTKQN